MTQPLAPRPDLDPDDRDFETKLIKNLNPEQAEAVRHDLGPLLILAGAGSGKTRVITHRIAWLIRVCGVRPAQILAITFTNKAADEMKKRVIDWIGAVAESMWIGTFHSMMARILRRFADKAGRSSSFTILDADDQLQVVKSCLTDLNYDEKAFDPRSVLATISSAKSALQDAEDFAAEAGGDYRQSRLAKVYALYQHKLMVSNAFDFDDLLVETVRLFENHPDILALYQHRFRYILVDEYQDTNHAQYRLVRLLAEAHGNLCVVGDDDQSIYSFRGANIRNILDFEKDFTDCKVIKLERNYRSTGTVLNAANAVIGVNRGRKSKTLWTAADGGDRITFLRAENQFEEGRFIAGEINRRVTRGARRGSYRDFAVLYRLNALSRNLEQSLREQGVPYRIYGGVRFYDRKEIKDILAYLRLVQSDSDDIALMRVINVPRRGIGDATLEVLSQIAARQGMPLARVCAEADQYPELKSRAGRLRAFAALLDKLRGRLNADTQSLADYIAWVEEESGLIAELTAQQNTSGRNEAIDRVENLKELLSDALEFESQVRVQLPQQNDERDEVPVSDDLPGLLRGFLERAALYASIDDDRDQEDVVRLMTIHSAKGLEFDTVFLVGAEEGLFPGYRAMGSEADIEEERRLAYVAITRAKRKLYLTTTRSRLVFGQTQTFPVSRFVREIPDAFIEEIGGPRDELGGSGRGDPSRSGLRDTYLAGMPAFSGKPVVSGKPAASGGFPGKSAFSGKPAAGSAGGMEYHVGDHVLHPRFGPGRVTDVTYAGGDAILVVVFEEAGSKRLMASQARLSKAP